MLVMISMMTALINYVNNYYDDNNNHNSNARWILDNQE